MMVVAPVSVEVHRRLGRPMRWWLMLLANPFGIAVKGVGVGLLVQRIATGAQSPALAAILPNGADWLWWAMLAAASAFGLLGYFARIPRLEVAGLLTICTCVAVLWLATAAYYGRNGWVIAPYLPAVSIGALGRAVAVILASRVRGAP